MFSKKRVDFLSIQFTTHIRAACHGEHTPRGVFGREMCVFQIKQTLILISELSFIKVAIHHLSSLVHQLLISGDESSPLLSISRLVEHTPHIHNYEFIHLAGVLIFHLVS